MIVISVILQVSASINTEDIKDKRAQPIQN